LKRKVGILKLFSAKKQEIAHNWGYPASFMFWVWEGQKKCLLRGYGVFCR